MNERAVTIVGNITRDTIYRPEKPSATSLGGSLYCTLALAALAPEVEIIPVANVGEDIYDDLLALLTPLQNVNLAGLRRLPRPNVHTHLFFVSEYGVQFDEGQGVPVTYQQLRPFLNSYFLLITFPTGFDMELKTLRRLTRGYAGQIHLDYHILTRGRDESGVRYLRQRSNWRQWVEVADFVQFNRFEAEYLSRRPIRDRQEIEGFGRSLLGPRTKGVIVTDGPEGAYLVSGSPRLATCEHTPVRQPVVVKDTIGCGCVFVAGFIAAMSHGLQLSDAAIAAVEVASLRCTANSTAELVQILSPNHLLLPVPPMPCTPPPSGTSPPGEGAAPPVGIRMEA